MPTLLAEKPARSGAETHDVPVVSEAFVLTVAEIRLSCQAAIAAVLTTTPLHWRVLDNSFVFIRVGVERQRWKNNRRRTLRVPVGLMKASSFLLFLKCLFR